ncbi:hypothetical protein NIES2109_26490 [Nostoc sp. HK-01]|uniref:DUF4112 domain-containing protein n=2 Tax=Nostocales TaxID=1161 RepID=A0A1Z4GFG3_9CYAN|nr:DUF4112 domain-containing protein [Nostoc cycadae]BAY16076.1 hypothetical protein NIES21_18990 [Anabaenopsis circularis NIES-21]BBD59858.1 hypothetical protein NIES2109_26490 [Nostoc sp. HK-01]GBE92479.1 hypothetical protein NCWK1_2235 [Nostoc cycadae WK-1]
MPDSSSRFPQIDPDAQAPSLRRLRQLSRVMDKAITIPGTEISVGLDPLLGLLPVGGDVIGLVFSSYIILEAARLGATKATLGRMILNIIIDSLVGSLPVAGDLFDFAWKSNEYNLKLLEEHLKVPRSTHKADTWFVLVVLLGLLLLGIVLITIPVLLISTLWRVITGG